ncbi:hypothetical protein D3C75_1267090 [compost metagenome]
MGQTMTATLQRSVGFQYRRRVAGEVLKVALADIHPGNHIDHRETADGPVRADGTIDGVVGTLQVLLKQ